MWLPHLEALSERVDVIAPEHPGYGETEMPDWLDGFDDLVIHYDELLDVLGARPGARRRLLARRLARGGVRRPSTRSG